MLQPVPSDFGDAEESRESYKVEELRFPLTLPCGYMDDSGTLHREVELHPMTGYEEDLLLNEKKIKGGENLKQIVQNCLLRVGSYEWPFEGRNGEQKAQVAKVANGFTISDRTFLILVLRRCSLEDGDTYRFPARCPNDACQHEYVAACNLAELDIFPMPDPEKRVYEFELPHSKAVVRYRHLLSSDDARVVESVKRFGESFLSASLWLRIIDVNGGKVQAPRDLQKWSTRDREALRSDMTRTDGGIDLQLSLRCDECRTAFRAPLELGPSFFLPSSLSTKRRF